MAMTDNIVPVYADQTLFHLYVLPERFLWIRQKTRNSGYGAMFGVAGVLAEEAIKKKLDNNKQKSMEGKSLEEQVQADKANLDIPRDRLIQISMKKKSNENIELQISYLNEKGKKKEIKGYAFNQHGLLTKDKTMHYQQNVEALKIALEDIDKQKLLSDT